MREILTGARRRIEESLGKDWGPFVLVQDLAAEKFELDHFQPYANGDMGRVHIKIGPDLGFGGRVSGFVHTKDMNFIRDNVGLTECTFNREPVQVSVPVISTINVSGTWRGTGRWASTWRGTGRLASSESFQIVMSLSQSGKAVSGRVSIHNRPAPLADYDADIIGKADDNTVALEFVNPESRTVSVDFTLTSDGILMGRAVDLRWGVGQFELKRAE